MVAFLERLGTFVIAVALLFAALRVHKSSGKHSKVTKPVGVILAFFAGCAFLVTFVGSWMAGLASGGMGAFFVGALIVCVAIIAVDWLFDGRPDKGAFWAAFVLAAAIVFGVASIPKVTGQIGDGGARVTSQIEQVGR